MGSTGTHQSLPSMTMLQRQNDTCAVIGIRSPVLQSATCKRGERKARFERARECLRLKAKLVCASKPGAFDCDDPEFDNYLNK